MKAECRTSTPLCYLFNNRGNYDNIPRWICLPW